MLANLREFFSLYKAEITIRVHWLSYPKVESRGWRVGGGGRRLEGGGGGGGGVLE